MNATTPSLQHPTIPFDGAVPVTVTFQMPADLVRLLAEYAAVQTGGSVGELCAETIFEKWAPHLSRLGRMDVAA